MRFCKTRNHFSLLRLAGVLTANASWSETVTLPGGGPGSSSTVSGSGNDVAVLPGFYVGLDGQYKFNDRWSVEAGVQYQNLGTYDHDFSGRTAELDLSRSVFVHVGVSFSF